MKTTETTHTHTHTHTCRHTQNTARIPGTHTYETKGKEHNSRKKRTRFKTHIYIHGTTYIQTQHTRYIRYTHIHTRETHSRARACARIRGDGRFCSESKSDRRHSGFASAFWNAAFDLTSISDPPFSLALPSRRPVSRRFRKSRRLRNVLRVKVGALSLVFPPAAVDRHLPELRFRRSAGYESSLRLPASAFARIRRLGRRGAMRRQREGGSSGSKELTTRQSLVSVSSLALLARRSTFRKAEGKTT